MKPADLSVDAWDAARNFLTKGFTTSIAGRGDEVVRLGRDIESIEAYDFKFVNWETFINAQDRPDGLIERAIAWKNSDDDSTFVIYDPLDDANGFLIVHTDPQVMANEAIAYILTHDPETGPLANG